MEQTSDLLQTVLLDADKGEQYSKQSSSVSGLADVWQRFALSVAKAARMPMTVLFGQSPSGLNTDGESSRQNWNKRIHSFQEDQIGPAILRVFSLARPGVELDLSFNPLNEPTESDKADVRLKTAKTDQIYFNMGARTADQVARSRDSEDGWSMKTEPREDIQKDQGFEAMQELERAIEAQRSDALESPVTATPYSGWQDPHLPASVRKLPPNAVKMWVRTFNETLSKNTDKTLKERKARAFSAAWSSIDWQDGNPFDNANQ